MKISNPNNLDSSLGKKIKQEEIMGTESTQKAIEILSRIFTEGGGH